MSFVKHFLAFNFIELAISNVISIAAYLFLESILLTCSMTCSVLVPTEIATNEASLLLVFILVTTVYSSP